MADCPHRVDHRCTSARAAIVLVHGFGGNAEATWGLFPELLKKEPRLQNWDVFSLGYSTSLAFDLAGVWSADPEIITLGGLIQTVTDVAPLDRYGSLAILAHSIQQIASMYQQAFRAADLMGEEALASELRAMFGHSPTVAPA